MTEREFYQEVAYNSWWPEGNTIYCPFCSQSVDSFEFDEIASQKIQHKENCPVLYARARLEEMEEVEYMELLLVEEKPVEKDD